MKRSLALAVAALAACAPTPPRPADPPLELFDWQRGIAMRARGDTPMAMYLWFYEWNVFDAAQTGELSSGSFELEHHVASDGRTAEIRGDWLQLDARVVSDGVELEWTVENKSDHDWPDDAALIACFNPGPKDSRTFEMGHHLKTYMLGVDGLERVPAHEMHFAHDLRAELARRSAEMKFDFSDRWETSERDSTAGLLLRESLSGGWTSGVAWERWLGVQAHNFWLCMHVATRVGPLARGAKRTVRGKLYLFPGDRFEGLKRYEHDFRER